MARSWASIMGAIRYGYKPFYFLTVDGSPVIHSEVSTSIRAGGEPTDDTYTVDASLVVDDSARNGGVLDEKSHLAKAFDFEARLLETPVVRDLFARPTAQTYLTADIDDATTSLPVESTAGFGAILPKPFLYYGLSCAPTTWGYRRDSFESVDRGEFGSARSYKKGTVVSDRPQRWPGRRVCVYVGLIDPMGRVVQSTASLFSDACMMWVGHIQEQPRKNGVLWRFVCRDQIRRPTEPLGVAASGQAKWTLDDDSPLLVPENLTISVNVTIGGVERLEATATPFAGIGGTRVARSKIRQLIADSLEAAIADGDPYPTHRFYWKCIRLDGPSGGIKRTWQMFVEVDTDSDISGLGLVICRVQTTGNVASPGLVVIGSGVAELITGPSAAAQCPSALYQDTEATAAGLSVTLEEGTYERLPSEGWVVLESDNGADFKRYVSKTQDANDYRVVILGVEASVSSSQVPIVASQELAGTVAEVSAKFLWRDTGPVPDVLRRSLASGGDGANGTFDTLPAGQGYDLPYIDENSFDIAFDGAFLDVTADVAVEGGSSLEKLFGGLLKLSQRAIVTRRSESGDRVNITAISVGAPDGPPVATITDESLVAMDGRKPVRSVGVYKGPQSVGIKCKTIAAGVSGAAEAEIELTSDHLTPWTSERWSIEVYGIPRSALVLPAYAWALAWFRGGENRQVVEIDVPPWYDVQAGDIVALDIGDPTLFDYASGRSGLVGLARCIGAQFSMMTGVVTLTIETAGISAAGPMSPSIIVSGNDGTATAPTAIYVDDAHLELFQYAKGDASTFRVLAYLPGSDTGHAEYTISAVALDGGSTKLTVSVYPSSPAVTLTNAFRLTWPIADNSTTEQNRFLHTSHRVQWS